MSEKVIVTGGAGFIGSHLVEELVKKNFEVIVIDNLYTGNLKNLEKVSKDINFIKGDICDCNLLKKQFKDVSYVFHEAALRNVRASVEQPFEYNKVNIDGTLNVLNAAKENNVKRVIFASSSSIYGNAAVFPTPESELPCPLSPYALTKIAGEYYLNIFYKLFGLETISLRYFNVFGPRQDFSSPYAGVVAIFIDKVLKNEQPEIFGDGKQSRDFTFVKDVVNANIYAMGANKKCCGQAFNIAKGKSISVNYILKKVNEFLGKDIKPIYTNPKLGDVNKTQANPTKAKKLLNFECKFSFEEGLKKTIEWFKNSD